MEFQFEQLNAPGEALRDRSKEEIEGKINRFEVD